MAQKEQEGEHKSLGHSSADPPGAGCDFSVASCAASCLSGSLCSTDRYKLEQ